MKKFSALLILSVSMFSLNTFADDLSEGLQKPVMEKPQKPVDVVSGIKAGAIVLRDGAEYGYYEMNVAGQWVFHQVDIVIEGVGRDAHVVVRGLGPVLASDGKDIAQGLQTAGADIAQPYKNMKNQNNQDVAHAVGDTGVLLGEAGKKTGVGLDKAGAAIGRTVGDAAVESYSGDHKPDDVVSGIADTGRFFGKIGKKIIAPIGQAGKWIDGHYVVPVKLENKKEKQDIAEAIAARKAADNTPTGVTSLPSSAVVSGAYSEQKPVTSPGSEDSGLGSTRRAPAVLDNATNANL